MLHQPTGGDHQEHSLGEQRADQLIHRIGQVLDLLVGESSAERKGVVFGGGVVSYYLVVSQPRAEPACLS